MTSEHELLRNWGGQLLPGVLVGHAEKLEVATGCTVIALLQGAVAGVDVRGGSPGTRELALLDPVNTVEQVNAVLLTGGSAFGLDAAAGVMRWLERQGAGLATPFARVPIVVGAVLYDLGIGAASVRPDAELGAAACAAATSGLPQSGCVGAGAGATVGKLAGSGRATKSGIGFAREAWGELVVEALVAVNAVGEVVGEDGRIRAGIRGDSPGVWLPGLDMLRAAAAAPPPLDGVSAGTNTTIGCVWTNAKLSKATATKVAQMSHDGLARSIRPVHTPHDGDTLFALSVGELRVDLTVVGTLAAQVTAAAVRRAVDAATDLAGCPAASSWQAPEQPDGFPSR